MKISFQRQGDSNTKEEKYERVRRRGRDRKVSQTVKHDCAVRCTQVSADLVCVCVSVCTGRRQAHGKFAVLLLNFPELRGVVYMFTLYRHVTLFLVMPT